MRPPLFTDRLCLRLAVASDVPAIVDFYARNADFHGPWSPFPPEGFFTEDYWSRRILTAEQEFARGESVRLYLFGRINPERIIGTVTLNQIHRGAAQYCVLGYSLSQESEGKGLMFEALQAVIDYAFKDLRLHRIMANYMPGNVRSGRLLKWLGFVEEGLAKDYLLINGKWEDHVLTAITNPDWQPLT